MKVTVTEIKPYQMKNSDSMEVVLYDDSNEIIKELFDSPQIVYKSF